MATSTIPNLTADGLLDKNNLSSCDLNDIKNTGVYALGTSQTYQHAPAAYGVFEVYKPAPSNTVFMIQRLYTSTDMFYRFFDGSAWRDWRKVTATSV